MEERTLLVSSTAKGAQQLLELLDAPPGYVVQRTDGAAARRTLIEEAFGLVIINAPLSDEFGHELALYAVHNTPAGVVLLVKSELFEEVASRVEQNGVFPVAKPMSRGALQQAVRMAAATHARITGLMEERQQLVQRIENMRLVNRAKCALMQYLSMTEAEAHRYLSKQAMNLRTSKETVAREILKMYEV